MHKLSRRCLLEQAGAFGAALATGCGKEKPKPLSCVDTTGLSPVDLQVRAALAYVDLSIMPGKMCSNCQQFVPGAPNVCGTCKVVKGPINPTGYCKSFVLKPA
jgi:hypothetical protein